MKKLTLTALSALVFLAAAPARDSMRGPLPEEQRTIIHTLAEKHESIRRKVSATETGYTATTTSDDTELVALLKKHLAYMKKRMESGAMVRRWDPAFEELVAYHDQLEVTVEEIENGVRVTVTGKNEDAIKVARNHARIVSGFVEKGEEALRSTHEKALEK